MHDDTSQPVPVDSAIAGAPTPDVTPVAQPDAAPAPSSGSGMLPGGTPDATAAPTAASVLGGTPAPTTSTSPEGFKGGFKSGFFGRKYTPDAQGNLQPNAPPKGGSSTLGSILGTIAMGALTSLGGVKQGLRGAAASASGYRSADAQLEDRDELARQHAQRNFVNQQDVAKTKLQQQEGLDKHNFAMVEQAKITQDMNQSAEDHPLVKAALEMKLQTDAVMLTKGYQEIQSNQINMIHTLAENGIDPSVILNSYADAQAHIPAMVGGKSIPIQNGKTGDENGAHVYPTGPIKDTFLTKPATYKTYDGTLDKDGVPIAQTNTIQPDGHTTVADYLKEAIKGQAQLTQLQKVNEMRIVNQKAKADIAEKNAAASKDKAEGYEAEQKGNEAKENAKVTAMFEGTDALNASGQPKTGQDYLNSLAPGVRNTLQGIWDGTQYVSPRQLQGKEGQKLLFALNQAFPKDPNVPGSGFDTTKIDSYQKLRTSMTSGPLSQTIQAGNTALPHLERLYDNIHWYTVGPVGSVASFFGNEAAANVKNTKAQVTDELAQAYNKGAVTDTERDSYKKQVDSASPLELPNAIKNIAHLLGDKLAGVQSTWDNGTPRAGIVPPFPIMNENARTAYKKLTGNEPPIRAISPANPHSPPLNAPPAETLQEGVVTHYANGQDWTIRNGNPVLVPKPQQ